MTRLISWRFFLSLFFSVCLSCHQVYTLACMPFVFCSCVGMSRPQLLWFIHMTHVKKAEHPICTSNHLSPDMELKRTVLRFKNMTHIPKEDTEGVYTEMLVYWPHPHFISIGNSSRTTWLLITVVHLLYHIYAPYHQGCSEALQHNGNFILNGERENSIKCLLYNLMRIFVLGWFGPDHVPKARCHTCDSLSFTVFPSKPFQIGSGNVPHSS